MAKYTDIRFPSGFYWGCASASHQVEGNCTKNDWWAWEQEGGHIHDGSVSGIACDHYNRFEEDFALAQELGHNAHRLSIEWSRIEPEEGQWDMAEVDHYRRVMESLRQHGLTPFVTLHHFTNPLWFRDRGGWLDPQAPELIARYAGFIAKELGDLVPFWFTINEPLVVVTESYLIGNWPPQVKDMSKALLAARHLLLAHAKMYQAVKESTTHGPQVGVVLNMPYLEPKNPDSPGDRATCEMADTVINQYFLTGIDKGIFPPPVGQGEEALGVKGTWDAIGLNYYYRILISEDFLERAAEYGEPPPGAELSSMGWEVYPEGIHHMIKRLAPYGRPIYITENGFPTENDDERCRYVLRHLQQMHRAISEGADLRGYLHWSFTDNFEWAEGWGPKLGMIAMEPGTLNRKPRPFAYLFRDIARANAITAEQLEKYVR
jgi:beta-glucosidase